MSARVVESIHEMLEEVVDITPQVTDEVREDYKFGECVPDPLLEKMVSKRFSCDEAWEELKKREVTIVK